MLACSTLSDGLIIWTLYERPLDYPNGYVVRRSVSSAAGIVNDLVAQYAPTLELAMRLAPPGLFWMPRQPGDDPCILGTWF